MGGTLLKSARAYKSARTMIIAICSTMPLGELELELWRNTLNEGVIRSPFPRVEMPNEMLASRLVAMLHRHAKSHPNQPAVIEAQDENRSITFGEIIDKGLRFANFLVSSGLKVGDKVTVSLSNTIEWPVLLVGIYAAGGIVIGSSTTFKVQDAAYQLKDSQSSIIIVSEETIDVMREAALEYTGVNMIICIRHTDKTLPDNVVDYSNAFDLEPIEMVPVSPDAIGHIFYTSGTTGFPKGAMHTQRSLLMHIDILKSHWENQIFTKLGVESADWHQEVQVIASSCCHILGYQLMMWSLLCGSTAVVLPMLDGPLYDKVVKTYKPRFLILMPPGVAYFTKDPFGREIKMDSVQFIITCTAKLRRELAEEFVKLRPHVKYMVQAYGSTELTFCHVPTLNTEGINMSSGVLVAGYEQKIVNLTTGRPCKQGEQGEIYLRAPCQIVGYLNKPESTREAIDDEGWVHTGDLGYMDELGQINILSRLKEVIKICYNNVSLGVLPAQVDEVLLSHPKIRDAGVVGVPDPVANERVCACIVREDESLTEEEINQYILAHMAEYNRITGGVFFVQNLPRTGNGKLKRNLLRQVCIPAN